MLYNDKLIEKFYQVAADLRNRAINRAARGACIGQYMYACMCADDLTFRRLTRDKINHTWFYIASEFNYTMQLSKSA